MTKSELLELIANGENSGVDPEFEATAYYLKLIMRRGQSTGD